MKESQSPERLVPPDVARYTVVKLAISRLDGLHQQEPAITPIPVTPEMLAIDRAAGEAEANQFAPRTPLVGDYVQRPQPPVEPQQQYYDRLAA